METQEIKAKSKKQWHDVDIHGDWRLIYTVGNNNGPTAFGGKHLGTYKSPFDGSTVYRRSVDNVPLNGFMIDKLSIKLTPDSVEDHKLLISWLICHDEVQLEGIPKIHPKILAAKSGGKVTLKCLDYIETEKLDEEDYVDKIIGRISLDSGKYAIGIDSLRSILASLNLSYRDTRFEANAETEKKSLRSKLKTFTRKSIENAKLVQEAIDNLEDSKTIFIFKEMLKHHVIVDFGGSYKFNNVPLGSSMDKVLSFFDNHPEVKAEALQELYKIIN